MRRAHIAEQARRAPFFAFVLGSPHVAPIDLATGPLFICTRTLLYEIKYPEVPGVLIIARGYILTEALTCCRSLSQAKIKAIAAKHTLVT